MDFIASHQEVESQTLALEQIYSLDTFLACTMAGPKTVPKLHPLALLGED